MPNISIVRLVELERKEKMLEELTKQKAVEWVGKALGEAWATCQAGKSWDTWTEREKALLQAVCRDAYAAYQLYKELLPPTGKGLGGSPVKN